MEAETNSEQNRIYNSIPFIPYKEIGLFGPTCPPEFYSIDKKNYVALSTGKSFKVCIILTYRL